MAMLGPCPQPLMIPLYYQKLLQPCRGGCQGGAESKLQELRNEVRVNLCGVSLHRPETVVGSVPTRNHGFAPSSRGRQRNPDVVPENWTAISLVFWAGKRQNGSEEKCLEKDTTKRRSSTR